MELAFLLRGVGAEVVWITNQKPAEPDEVVYNLEHKMLDRGVQVNFIFLKFPKFLPLYFFFIKIKWIFTTFYHLSQVHILSIF